MPTVTTRWVDRGWNRIKTSLRGAENKVCDVGLFDWGRAKIAFYNEFGTPGAKYPIPPRPFMRNSFDQNLGAHMAMMQRGMGAILDGTAKIEGILGAVGTSMEGHQSLAIANSRRWAVANAPRTIRNKGFDWPLVETFEMWQQITSKIRRRR